MKRGLLLSGFLLLLPAAQAAAVSISFSQNDVTLVQSGGLATITTTISFNDLANPDPNVATFEMDLASSVVDYSELSAGTVTSDGLLQDLTVYFIERYSLYVLPVGTAATNFLSADLLSVSGIDPSYAPETLGTGSTLYFSAHIPFRSDVTNDFLPGVDWSAHVLVTLDPDQAGQLQLLGYVGAEGGTCIYLDGVEQSCDYSGGSLDPVDPPTISYTAATIPEPTTALLFAGGLGVAAVIGRRRPAR